MKIKEKINTNITVLNAIKSKSFIVENFGCQMNVADANEISKSLEDIGFIKNSGLDIPDIVIINSCAIRGTAEDKIYKRLAFYNRFRQEKNITIIMMGCLAQKDKDEALKRAPFIDLVIGTNQKYALPTILLDHYTSNSILYKNKVYDSMDGYKFNKSLQTVRFKFKADINIMQGCNKFCTYCIVPFTRGKEISRPSQDIIQNIKELVSKGVTEVLLLGQNVNSYGKDNSEIIFPELLSKVSDINGLKRIRFITSHPMDFNLNLINVIAERPNICKYIHLPLQSGSDKVLQYMKRYYTYDNYMNIVNTARSKIKNLVLTTDIIAGFPYEEEEDFEKTLFAIQNIRYDNAYIFKYSIRKGTEAEKYTNHLSDDIKKERLKTLMNAQKVIRDEINNASIGNIETILLEGQSKSNPEYLLGKTDGNKSVVLKASKEESGKYIKVKITGIRHNTFQAERI